MTLFFYNIFLACFRGFLPLVAIFNPKARLLYEGQKQLFTKLRAALQGQGTARRAWVHCASLGEYEQARPVLEQLRQRYPHLRIVLTFFSPSGYEVQKESALADIVSYLPLDSHRHAQEFLDLVQPEIIFFVKYELWYYHLTAIGQRQIPCYLFSAIFRPSQIFFQPYGAFYRKVLAVFKHIFVQNEASLQLLQNIGLESVSIAHDTRFDRVWAISQAPESIPLAATFAQGHFVWVIGSCWDEDLQVLIPFINQLQVPCRIIIAPHNIVEANIETLGKNLQKPSIRFSQATPEALQQSDILIIDNVGMLSQLYQYADICYVGGAFRSGLHNILEAVCFGAPVIFGPHKYHKYQEALDLLAEEVAFRIGNVAELKKTFDQLYHQESLRKKMGQKARNYIQAHKGGAEKILAFLEKTLSSNASL